MHNIRESGSLVIQPRSINIMKSLNIINVIFFLSCLLTSEIFIIHVAQFYKVIRNSEIKLSRTAISNYLANNRSAICLEKEILRHFAKWGMVNFSKPTTLKEFAIWNISCRHNKGLYRLKSFHCQWKIKIQEW